MIQRGHFFGPKFETYSKNRYKRVRIGKKSLTYVATTLVGMEKWLEIMLYTGK